MLVNPDPNGIIKLLNGKCPKCDFEVEEGQTIPLILDNFEIRKLDEE